MARATRSLSPKLALERLQRHRSAVITLAHQAALKVVKARIRAEGKRLHDFSARDLRIQAEQYFEANRAELLAQAKEVVATYPGFERWRCPPEVFEKVTKIEHSPKANSAIVGTKRQ
jgi:hypothetical protein